MRRRADGAIVLTFGANLARRREGDGIRGARG